MKQHLVWALALAVFGMGGMAHAQSIEATKDEVSISQDRGVDQRVNYSGLTRFGPWDDRNYMLTLEDVQLLPEDDHLVRGVPAFFKVEYRKKTPEMAGWNMYPRSMDQEFQLRFGGLMQGGQVIPQGLGKQLFALPRRETFKDATRVAPVLSNIVLDAGSNRNECTIEYNPANNDQVIAGCNGAGQEQYFSSNGGQTWAVSGNLPATCCDPALEWSVDGTIAYAATLGNSGGLRATVFRSIDAGATWGNRIDVSTGSSDKEWIHVDRAPGSPFRDNVYLTWHQGNIMFFARSTNRGESWATPQQFPGALRGIGSDITTGPDGTLYYIYPSLNGTPQQSVMMLKSTNGGQSFLNPTGTSIAQMRGRFEAGVPSMETRRTFFYISTDTDLSNGPRRGRIYVSWTDLSQRSPVNNGVTSTNTNNVRIRVIYSDNGGDTWTEAPAPHEIETTTTDSCGAAPACIDRYHQWIDVDNNGVLHIGYYDTRNDLPNRGRVDFYYTYSTDGAASWDLPATRVSQVSSNNIANGQEWGDYNGLSVSLIKNKIMTIWTDNRPSTGQKANAGEIVNVTGFPFQITAPTTTQSACAGTNAGPFALSLSSFTGAGAVTLSTPGAPAQFQTATFVPNPVTPSASGTNSSLTVGIAPGAPAGPASLPVRGTAGADIANLSIPFTIFSGTPALTTLTAPASGAINVPIGTAFSWSTVAQSPGYRIEISRFSNFSVLYSAATVTATSFTPEIALRAGTQFFWRVRGANVCGNGTFAGGSFTTAGTGVILSDGFEGD